MPEPEMHKEKDQNVVTGTRTCDPQQWVAKYAGYFNSYAISRINDEEFARDLMQETFLAALERVEKLEGRSSENTWLTAILKNKIIDVYQKKSSGLLKRRDIQSEELDPDIFFEPEDGHWKVQHQPQAFGIKTYDQLASKEFNYILQQCMQKLPELWLSVFTMNHMDDQATDLICSELKVTPSNFWVFIHSTKVNLRACLQKN